MYALSAQFKTHRWFAFGTAPSALDRKVVELAQKIHTEGFECFEDSDISKLDGSKGRPHYFDFVALVLHSFSPVYHDTLLNLLQNEKIIKGCTAFRVIYNVYWSTCSGSPDTTVSNTQVPALEKYEIMLNSGMTPDQAWDRMGIYGGDDAIDGAWLPDGASRTLAKSRGLEVKTSRTPVHKHIVFLGRVYPFPLTSPQNMADPRRILPRLHIIDHTKTIEQGLLDKASAFLVTDPHTPILGVWSRKINDLIKLPDYNPEPGSFKLLLQQEIGDPDDTFNVVDGHDEDYSLFADLLGVSVEAIHAAEQQIIDAESIEDCFPVITVTPFIEPLLPVAVRREDGTAQFTDVQLTEQLAPEPEDVPNAEHKRDVEETQRAAQLQYGTIPEYTNIYTCFSQYWYKTDDMPKTSSDKMGRMMYRCTRQHPDSQVSAEELTLLRKTPRSVDHLLEEKRMWMLSLNLQIELTVRFNNGEQTVFNRAQKKFEIEQTVEGYRGLHRTDDTTVNNNNNDERVNKQPSNQNSRPRGASRTMKNKRDVTDTNSTHTSLNTRHSSQRTTRKNGSNKSKTPKEKTRNETETRPRAAKKHSPRTESSTAIRTNKRSDRKD